MKIVYANEKYFPSFHQALSTVARELIYIEMIEAPPLQNVATYQASLIAQEGPVYYAIENEQVVGWCDVFPEENPRQKHRGTLGMGLLPNFRKRGLGSKLLEAVLVHSKKFGLEKVELNVYTSNTAAIQLYRKYGFVEEGLIKKYRKLGTQEFDCLVMAKFL